MQGMSMHDDSKMHTRQQAGDPVEPARRPAAIHGHGHLMSQAIGVSNHELLTHLQCVGFTAETIVLLELAPLIEIAWADGTVSERQRDYIFQIATRELIGKDTPARDRLVSWLEQRPSDDVFDVSLAAIYAKLDSLEPEVRAMLRRRFVADCTAVSLAADSVLGDDRISMEERRVLARILMSLRPRRSESSRPTWS
jgi:hypothetical protein